MGPAAADAGAEAPSDAATDGAATDAAAVGAATDGAVVAPPELEHAESAMAAPPMRAISRPADVCFNAFLLQLLR